MLLLQFAHMVVVVLINNKYSNEYVEISMMMLSTALMMRMGAQIALE